MVDSLRILRRAEFGVAAPSRAAELDWSRACDIEVTWIGRNVLLLLEDNIVIE